MTLTVLAVKNIYGVQSVAAGTTLNAVVLDNCEMNNQYGNNEQWCVPFSAGVPSDGCQLLPLGYPTCENPQCSTGESLTQAGGTWSKGVWDYSAECGTPDAFTCTNGAGFGAHVDVALDGLDQFTPPWDSGANPVVSVEYVACPESVSAFFEASCSEQSGVTCSYASV